MIAVWIFLRAELSRRWRAWLSVVLLAGAFAGVVMAAAAGARRTDSAYPRLLAWSKAPDLVIFPGDTPGFATLPREALAQLPQAVDVARVRPITTVVPAGINLIIPEDSRIPGTFWKRKMLAGRLAAPDRANEVNVSFTLAQSRHLGVGDTVRFVLPTKRGKPVTVAFRVAGIDAAPGEFPPQIGTSPGSGWVWTTPAFWRSHRAESQADPIAVLRLRHGDVDVAAAQHEIARLPRGKLVGSVPLAPGSANTQRSIHLQAVALWLLAALLAVIGVLVLGQLLVRLSFVESNDYGALRALGMSRRQLVAVGLGRAAAIGVAAAGVGVVLAVALSPLLPGGLAGVAEPDPGMDADGLVLVAGALAAVLITVACAAWPAWMAAARAGASEIVPIVRKRGRTIIAVLAANARSVPAMMGLRLALQPGAGRTALPVRSTIAGAVIGIAALSAALVFSASLSHLLATPRLYGVTWDANVASTANGDLTPAIKEIARDPQVAAWSAGYVGAPLRIGGVQVDFIAMSQRRGPSLMPPPVQGRLPQRPDEIALGAQTLAAMHAHVGGTAPASMLGSAPRRLKIVGATVFPALSDGLGLGQGAALTISAMRHLLPHGQHPPPFDTLLVRFHPNIGAQAGRDALALREAHAGPFIVLAAETPTDLVNFGRVQNLPMLLGIALSGLALAAIAHLLITSARRRRRDFAILRALGFTRSQIRRTAAWQAGTLTAVALAIGIPAGILCGRVAWRIFAHHLGILPVLDLPLQQFAVLVPIALGLAVTIAALPGESAARAKHTQLLTSE
jgi:ABC-type lipoprotein release transport system permease subunit